MSDGHHEPPYFESVGVSERQGLWIVGAGPHFEDCKIVRGIGSHEPGIAHFAVGEGDLKLIGRLHDVVVRDDAPLAVVDEPGAGALLGDLAPEPVVALDFSGDVDDRGAGRPVNRRDPSFQLDLGTLGETCEQGGHQDG